MPAFNPVDALLAALVAIGAAGGWARGFFRGAAALAALAAGVAGALWLYPVPLGWWPGLQASAWSAPLAFVAVLVLVRLVAGAAFGRVAATLPAAAQRHVANRMLGIVPGAASGAVDAAVVALLLLTLPVSDRVTTTARDSRVAEALAERATRLADRLAPVFEPAIDRTLQRLTVKPGSDESVALDFTVSDPRPLPDLEERMLALVNAERAAAGLPALRADPQLTAVARAHSRDMLARGYFAHLAPEGTTPFERMRAGGVRFRAAGENLALAPTLALAHRGLMNSPGHRENILRAAFGRVGIGVLDAGRHGLMVTQNFRD